MYGGSGRILGGERWRCGEKLLNLWGCVFWFVCLNYGKYTLNYGKYTQ